MENYYGSIRIKKPETLQKWIDRGWYQQQIKDGWIFSAACGRFRKEKCECNKCRKPNSGEEKKEVLRSNGFLNGL